MNYLAPGTGSGTGFFELPGTGILALAQPLVTSLVAAHWPLAFGTFGLIGCGPLAFFLLAPLAFFVLL